MQYRPAIDACFAIFIGWREFRQKRADLRTSKLSRLLLFVLSLAFCAGTSPAQGTVAQQITLFAPATEVPLNSAPFQILALSSADLPVTLAVDGPATLGGRILTVTGIGAITVSASQAGNNEFAPTSAQLVLHATAVAPNVQLSPVTFVYGTAFNPDVLKAAAMAAPVVDPAADAAILQSQLDTSLLGVNGPPVYLPDSPVFRYENNILTPTTDPNAPGGYSSSVLEPPYGLNYRVAFTCDCAQFETVIQARQSPYRLWVDGAYTSLDSVDTPGAYPRPLFVQVKFPDKRPRQIKFLVGGNAPFFGINTKNGDTITAPEVPLGFRVMIFGDSWTGPTILPPALPPAQAGLAGGGYPEALGEYFNWDYWDDGIGGTGFTNTGADALHRTFVERAQTDICPVSFNGVVILGGTNDGGAPESAEQTAVSATLSEIASCQPGAPIAIYSPQNSHPELEQALTTAVAQAHGLVTYTDMVAGTPWFYGDPLDMGIGNNYLYLNSHPTPLGHDYLAEKIAFDIVTRYPYLKPQLYSLFHPIPISGQFSYSVPVGTLLPAGTNPVSVSFTPEDAASFAPASGIGSVTVTKASSSIAIVSSQSSGIITVHATVLPQISGTPTGQVTFTDGGALLGTVPLADKTGNITLSPGMHTIAAFYAGDSNFLASSSGTALPIVVSPPPPVVVSPPDFTVALDHAQVTVAPGAQTTVRLTINPVAGLAGNLTLICLGLPQNAACTFNPVSLSLASTPSSTTLTIDAFAPSTAPLASVVSTIPAAGQEMIALCSLLGAGVLWPRRRSIKHSLLLLAVSLSACVGLIGCGSSAATVAAAPAPSPILSSPGPANTAPGQYNLQLQITANAGTTSAVTHSQTIVLQVS